MEHHVLVMHPSDKDEITTQIASRDRVYPKFTDVRPHHAELVSITGSKEPSGIAYIAPIVDKPKFGGRKPRPGQDQRLRCTKDLGQILL